MALVFMLVTSLYLVDQRPEVETLDVIAAGSDGLDLCLALRADDDAVDVALGAYVERRGVGDGSDRAHNAADQVEQLGPLFFFHRLFEPCLALVLVVDLQQLERDLVARFAELLLDLAIFQPALTQEGVDVAARPEVCEVVVGQLAALVELAVLLERGERLKRLQPGGPFLGLQALAVLDEADPLLSVVSDRVLFPVFEEVLQDLRGVCLEVGVAGDPGVELILPVCEGLAGLGQLGGRALDVLALDADVEAVGAFFNHFGELAVVLLEYGLALRHAALGVDDLLLELFLCHGGLLSSWPGRSRGSLWCRVPEKQKHDRRIASESSAEGVRSSSIFSVGVV